MKIGIAGYGFVGQAHEHILKDYHTIIISDPAKGHYGDLQHADCIIVCVSTPPHVGGYCDYGNVLSVVENAPDVPILIKSTISIEGWEVIVKTKKQVTFSPEFLRAAHWKEDIVNNKKWYFGGYHGAFWTDIFVGALGRIDVDFEPPETLILSKQLRNSFLALKVTFFNQIYDLCEAQGMNYEGVQKVVTSDPRIGSSHSNITEERGFGGHCLPKDTLATVMSARVAETEMSVLSAALEYNEKIQK